MTVLKPSRIAAISGAAPMKPLRAVGAFSSFALDTFVTMFTTRFAWRELLDQIWFMARVALVPALMLSIPYVVITVFTFNVLLVEFGAADLSGQWRGHRHGQPDRTFRDGALVAGAGASAMCADLGARTIREELDALSVMGIDPVQALLVPRVLAATVVALLLSSLVT